MTLGDLRMVDHRYDPVAVEPCTGVAFHYLFYDGVCLHSGCSVWVGFPYHVYTLHQHKVLCKPQFQLFSIYYLFNKPQ